MANLLDPQSIELLPASPGVYLLTHAITRDTYVGSADDVRVRIRQHRRAMTQGRSCSRAIRDLIGKRGMSFDVAVLEITTTEDRLRVEAKHIEERRPTLNRGTFKAGKPVRDGRPAGDQINFRLKKTTIERMETYKDRHPLHPTLTQIVEAAVADWLERHEAELPPKPRK